MTELPSARSAPVPSDAGVPSPQELRRRVALLAHDRGRHEKERTAAEENLGRVRGYLAIAPKVEAALQQLSQDLFHQMVGVLEEKLTIALQEVLEQPIRLKAEPSFKRGSASVDFHVERDGQPEDIMRGQGGSVANVLSVGLRMFALATLDPAVHRPFLVLDEQDCWLRPDLVPKLVKIVHEAGRALGFQVLMISHHDVALFERYADRIFQFGPRGDGSVEVRQVSASPPDPDPTL